LNEKRERREGERGRREGVRREKVERREKLGRERKERRRENRTRGKMMMRGFLLSRWPDTLYVFLVNLKGSSGKNAENNSA
jgi:hypothetical protein